MDRHVAAAELRAAVEAAGFVRPRRDLSTDQTDRVGDALAALAESGCDAVPERAIRIYGPGLLRWAAREMAGSMTTVDPEALSRPAVELRMPGRGRP